ncbi:MAG: hypothetical protein JST22_02795 [Bacteroidetes bacterium]|nr:hypothetical protein [Bacteroidota bacterium]
MERTMMGPISHRTRMPLSAAHLPILLGAFLWACAVSRTGQGTGGLPAGSAPGDRTQQLPGDTVLVHDVPIGSIDSLYISLSDTSARLLSIRFKVRDSVWLEVPAAAFERRSLIGDGREYTAVRIEGMHGYAAAQPPSTDIEFVVAGDTGGVLDVGVDCLPEPAARGWGGPNGIPGSDGAPAPAWCFGPWSVHVQRGCRVVTRISPANAGAGVVVRTIYGTPAASDTTVSVIWDCLLENGMRAPSGSYRVAISREVGARRGGARVTVVTVHM